MDSICGFLSSLGGVFVDAKDKGFSLLMSFVPWSHLLCKIDLGYFGFKILMRFSSKPSVVYPRPHSLPWPCTTSVVWWGTFLVRGPCEERGRVGV